MGLSTVANALGKLSEKRCPKFLGLPGPQITHPFFKDLYKEVMLRNQKKVGYLGSR